MKVIGRSPVAAKTSSQNLRDSKLNAAVASKVFGWKNVRKREGKLIGKKQDKAGRWRPAKVPDFANDPSPGICNR